MDKCIHTITQGRNDESGSWCCQCGEKIYEVDSRKCDDCENYARLINGSICKKHLMAVTADMNVTFKISEGSCWKQKALGGE